MAILLIFTKPKHIFIENRRDTQQELAFSLALHGWRGSGWKSGGPKDSAQEGAFPPSKLLLSQVAHESTGWWKHLCIGDSHVVLYLHNLQRNTNVGVFMATACVGNFFGTVWMDGWDPSSSWEWAEIHLPGANTGLAGSSPSLRCGCWQELYLLSAFTSLG